MTHNLLSKELSAKIHLLSSKEHTDLVALTPQEFLRCIEENNGLNHMGLANRLGVHAQQIKDVYRNQYAELQLPVTLAAKLAALFPQAPYNQTIFWRQTSYTLTNIDEIPVIPPKEKAPVTWQQTVSQTNTHATYEVTR